MPNGPTVFVHVGGGGGIGLNDANGEGDAATGNRIEVVPMLRKLAYRFRCK